MPAENKKKAKTKKQAPKEEEWIVDAPERTIDVEYSDVMQKSYVDYSMSVITARALPDVRDGLKPVQRRVLYDMRVLGVGHDKPYRKSARIVGDAMGKFHPHGDASIYDSLVVMSQDFKKSVPLVDGHGNFGSIEGDGAAAMRYCVTGDTLIDTSEGIIRIDQVVQNSDDNSSTPISMSIRSINGKIENASMFFNSGKQPVYEVVLKNGMKIKGSGNHPLLTIGADMEFKWSTVDQLSPGMKCVVDLDTRNQIFGRHDDIEEAKMLGCMISEGYMAAQNRIGINNEDIDMITPVKTYIEREFHKKPDVCSKKDGVYEYVVCGEDILNKFVNDFEFGNSYARHIPSLAFTGTKEYISTMVKYLFEGDGSASCVITPFDPNDAIELAYVSKSESLVRDIQLLLLKFGIYSSIFSNKKRREFKLVVARIHYKKFENEIGFVSDRKKEVLHELTKLPVTEVANDSVFFCSELSKMIKKDNPKVKRNITTSRRLERYEPYFDKEDYEKYHSLMNYYVFVPIAAVTMSGKIENVYSIRVDSQTHAFSANGFVNHNTEARLQPFAEDALLADLPYDVVDFVPNFDESEKEPSVLPARISNFLVNGAEGIAVGMATSVPPHNLGEIAEATIALAKNPKIGLDALMAIVPGPDFPTGGIVSNASELRQVYETGQGKIRVRGKVVVEKTGNGRERLVVTELPYTMVGANVAKFMRDVADLAEERIVDVADVSDQSSKDGIRIVIDLKKNADAKATLAALYAKTKLEDTFGACFLAISDGTPKTFGLKEALEESVRFQREIVTRKHETLLRKAEERSEIEEGLIAACDAVDVVIEILRGSKDRAQAVACMTTGATGGINFRTAAARKKAASFRFTQRQAAAILDMRLHRLIGLELEALTKEHEKTLEEIERCAKVLGSEAEKSKQIVKDLKAIAEKYARPRRTAITDAQTPAFVPKAKKEEPKVVIIDRSGYVRAIDVQTYERNVAAARETAAHVTTAAPGSNVVAVFDDGSMASFKAKDVPVGKLRDKGVPLDVACGEDLSKKKLVLAASTSDLAGATVAICTRRGLAKRVPGEEFDIAKRLSFATRLNDGDAIVSAAVARGEPQYVIATKQGWRLRMPIGQVSAQKRDSRGVVGISLGKGDEVVTAYPFDPEDPKGAPATELAAAAKTEVANRATKGRKADA